MKTLGINIDHVATIRQARRTIEPDPVTAAAMAELGGADGITIHLREDRRHIQDRDLYILKQTVKTQINLEMGLSKEIIAIALKTVPHQVTLVPERIAEVTTEGGLNVLKARKELAKVIPLFQKKKMVVSIFIDAELDQIKAAADLGAEFIELHTGTYADANIRSRPKELDKLVKGAQFAIEHGLRINVGHSLNYTNVQDILKNIPNLEELNIGHAIISRGIFTGLTQAVCEMKEIIIAYR